MSQPPQDPYEQQPGWPPQDPYEQQPGWQPREAYQQKPGWQDPYQQKPRWQPQDPYPYQQKPGWHDPYRQQPGQPPQDPYRQKPGWQPQGPQPYSVSGGQPPHPGPPQGHRTPRRRKRHLVRNILAGVGGLIVVSAVVSSLSKGGSTPAASTTTAAQSSAAAVAQTSSAPSPPSCTSQFTSWRDSGGLNNLTTVGSDLGTLSGSVTTLVNDMSVGADMSADEASVQQADASIESDVQTAQADLPPSCVPGMRKDVSAALTDYNTSAIDCNEGITELSSRNTSVATSVLHAGSQAMNAGNGKIAQATADVKAFSSS